MEKEAQRVNGPDQVMVMSRINQTNWKYMNRDDLNKRTLNTLKMENGGREVSQKK